MSRLSAPARRASAKAGDMVKPVTHKTETLSAYLAVMSSELNQECGANQSVNPRAPLVPSQRADEVWKFRQDGRSAPHSKNNRTLLTRHARLRSANPPRANRRQN